MESKKYARRTKAFNIRIRQPNVVLAAIGLFLLILTLSLVSKHFLTLSNIFNMLRQVSIIAIVSIGMTYVIVAGGIDLSVGSIVGLSGVIMAILLREGSCVLLAIVMGMVVGALCGATSGFLITSRIHMPPFIATLSMMSIARGITLVITKGVPVYGLPREFGYIASGYVSIVPIPVIIMIALYGLVNVHLAYNKTGVYYYAVGGNAEASRLTGISIKSVMMSSYIISGVMCAISGMILTSRMVSIEPLAGTGYELDAIAAVVIGGTNLYGGEGSIIGTFIGALIIASLKNGLNLLDVSTYWQQVVIGLVIAGILSINVLRNPR